MSDEKKNPYSQPLWEDTKDEAGVVATGVVLGGVVGVTGGYVVSQLAGTPLVPSMIIGGVGGGTIGGATGVYMAHRLGEARASAMLHTDRRISAAGLSAPTQEQEIATMIGDAVATSVAGKLEELMAPPPNKKSKKSKETEAN